MLIRVISLLIAVLVAWVIGPYLTEIFWFLPIKEIAEQINFRALLSKDASFYVGFVIWGLLLWKILEVGGLVFLVAGPQRAGNVPEVRRTQGLLLNAVILAVFASPITLAFSFTDLGRNRILDGIQRDNVPAEFLAAATVDTRLRLSEIEATLSNNAARQGALKIDGAVANLKDWWNGENKHGQEITAEKQQLAQDAAALKKEQNAAETNLSALITSFQENDPAAVALARAAVWEDIEQSRLWRRFVLAIRYLWLPALPFALLLYVPFGWPAKLLLARTCAPLLRRLDQYAMGLGGSARFAGLLEEILLHHSFSQQSSVWRKILRIKGLHGFSAKPRIAVISGDNYENK